MRSRRWRWSPAAARGCPGSRRTPPARSRTARGIPLRHATPGSGAGTAGCRGSARSPVSWWSHSRPSSAPLPPCRQSIQHRRARRLLPPGWSRSGVARTCGPRRRRRSPAVVASRQRPGRHTCGPTWPGLRRSADTAWRVGRARCAARPPRHWTAHRPRPIGRRGACAHQPRRCRAARRSHLR